MQLVKWEDKAICESFVSTSQDPIVEAYQKEVEFCSKMHHVWSLLHKKAADIKDKVYKEPRTVKQLIARWTKHIRPDMRLFCRH